MQSHAHSQHLHKNMKGGGYASDLSNSVRKMTLQCSVITSIFAGLASLKVDAVATVMLKLMQLRQ